jgi:hypothetical protein
MDEGIVTLPAGGEDQATIDPVVVEEKKPEEIKEEPPVEQEEPLKEKTNKRIRSLLAERDEWKAKALEAQAKASGQAPTLEQFDHDIEKYTEATVDHRTQANEAQRVNENVQHIAAQAQAEMLDTFQRDVAAKKDIYPDFEQVFHPGLPVTPQLAEIVVTSDDPAGVAYYLGKNPAVLAKLNNLPASMQGYEIAKIEGMVSAKSIPTKAPAPMQTKVVPTGGSGAKSYDDMSDAEFAAARAKERAKWRAENGY